MFEMSVQTRMVRAGVALNRAISYANYAWELIVPRLPRLRLSSSHTKKVTVDGLLVRCDRELPTDPSLTASWEDLYRRTPNATPFHSPAWQSAILETPEAMRRLRLFTIHDGSRLVGVLPLEARLGHILRTSGAMLTDYLDPLIDPQYLKRAWPAMLKGVRKLEPGRSVVLEHVRDEACHGCSELGDSAASAGFALVDSADHAVARIALPKTWDEYLASLDGHERKELKRKLKKAEQQGGATLQVCTDPNCVLKEMTATFELFQGCGGGKARKAKWLFPRHFSASAPALAASGRLVLYKLMIENRHAAGLIALPTNQGQILWNTAFDPAMKQWSPGIVMFAMLIRRAIEQGHTVFDLLRGQYDYKYRLGAADHPLHTLTLRPAA
jgi:CelD/BcsL family acetyltransferase involved in cellulose biosynthesis